ncbi:MAG: winged helix-turn-helix domain-containing protein [Candidatus Nitrosotenuis sp.]
MPPKTANKSSNLEITQFNQINIKKILATSLNILVIKRILAIVHQEGRINRTNLAGKTGLNYVVCSKYVSTLVLFGLLRILSDYNQYIVITERGIEIKKSLEILNEK